MTPHEAAIAALEAGLCPVPPRQDGSKAPLGKWKGFRTPSDRPSRAQLDRWYHQGLTGVGVVTGRASALPGDHGSDLLLELLEFDDADTYQAFLAAAPVAGLQDLVARVEAGYCETTPSGGIHWLYRCPVVEGNTKLARRPKRSDEMAHEHDRVAVLIETRGEGGYVITAPSNGTVHPSGGAYRLRSGGFHLITTISPDDRANLFELARSFDQMPAAEPPPAQSAPPPAGEDGAERPGDDYAARTSWADILTPHGWTLLRREGDTCEWRRPGKQDPGISATTREHAGLWVFSTATVFEAEQPYTKFAAYAVLNHGGDFTAAARALRARGYGTPPDPTRPPPPPRDPTEEASAEEPSVDTEPPPTTDEGDGPPPEEPPAPPSGSKSPPSYMCTDYGNAERLVDQHGIDLRHCHPWKKWLVWDGRRWRLDDTGAVERHAKRTVRTIYREAEREPDSDKSRRLGGWAAKSEGDARIKAMLSMARSEEGIPVIPGELDADPWVLNAANGTLDLRTGQLRPHHRADRLTKQTPIAYHPDAAAPTWLRFLDRIMDGDQELIAFLQRAVGYSLTGDTSEHCLFLPWGSGANGKSVFLLTVAALLGDYGQQAAPDLVVKKPKGAVPNDLADLRGARYVTIIETAEGEKLDEPLLKQLTGGDPVKARFLYAEHFEFLPQCKLWLATNHKPVIRGTDYGIWRRIRLVPFAVTIPEAERDSHLPGKLRAELPGILAWAVQGCLAWQRDGLQPPAAVRDATETYRKEQDVLAQFIEECCVVDPTVYAYTSDLYEAYEKYGGPYLSKTMFGRRLKEKGFDQGQVGHSNRRVWLGIALATHMT